MLKYTTHLPQTCEALVNGYSALYNDQIDKVNSEAIALANEPALHEAILKNLQEESKKMLDEMALKLTNIVFPYKLFQTSTDDMGSFHFINIPRGKYFIYIQKGTYTWLVPIELQTKEMPIELSQSNAYRFN